MATYYIGNGFEFSVNDEEFRKFQDAVATSDKLDVAARRAANGLVSILKSAAPVKTGNLRKGIIPSSFAERSATPGKVVYDVYFDEAMNDVFQKAKKGKGHYYYPASQEYGFWTRSRKRRVKGLYFMRDSSRAFYPDVEEIAAETVDEILEEIANDL